MITVFGGIKGGSGKTTLSTNICILQALSGKKVLLVDSDEQRSASDWSEHRENLEIDTAWTTITLSGAAVRSQVLKMKDN
jgi:chromosome partitioning protein